MPSPKTITEYLALFNDTVSGFFRANVTNLINSGASRNNVTVISESFVNKIDGLNLVDVDPTSAISLDFGVSLEWERRFKLTTTISTPKNVSVSNGTYAKKYVLHFEITDVAAALTLSSSIMSDVRFASSVWTAAEIGKYIAKGQWDGTNWKVDIYGPYA